MSIHLRVPRFGAPTGNHNRSTAAKKSIFRNTLTLDPHFAEAAWRALDVNTREIETAELPRRMHESLIISMKRAGLTQKTPTSGQVRKN